ncbi:4-(cytidine 5'-diphospho)-2-C-methyl-D-erythritol kinase [Roseovarius sp. TE539]|uniref:4-(cytidine 5'-diphospho)-2-C-methyl-D-erythritol kinase n=1 Tax=Roseovarius sp. TE539 TaxID=2249812 RepID=UPI000DE17217|nr:4-(cytidine 5'-diphospho)-2-C-methyl-D-erythritol kinase [Roseovarius sp. TE539]RBI77045.1 4-(cytidine 5'-diphospho)-2-C-methyl-D-erythritol kinase [Roseovarius sp. TE539]
MTTVESFASAKINLTLHVTGRRDDEYHELDSLVMFADIGDRVSAAAAETTWLSVEGPMASGVPGDATNTVMRAARMMGVSADIRLEKNLPPAAGIGGGSSDAAATLRALSRLSGRPVPDGAALEIGADVPVCLLSRTARMRGLGDRVEPVDGMPMLHVVLVNANVPVLTVEVFRRLEKHRNPAMPDDLPEGLDASGLAGWLKEMRNDLQEAAIDAEPVIAQVFSTLEATPGCLLARMSGSGGTCFGIYNDSETAASAEGRLREQFPSWWVKTARLNASG